MGFSVSCRCTLESSLLELHMFIEIGIRTLVFVNLFEKESQAINIQFYLYPQTRCKSNKQKGDIITV